MDDIKHPMPIGIILGLFFGKQIGVFGFCWIGIKMKLADIPEGMNLTSLYGTAALCGIGYTMSLFIGSLALDESGINNILDERIGILIGSILSGVFGYLILKSALRTGD